MIGGGVEDQGVEVPLPGEAQADEEEGGPGEHAPRQTAHVRDKYWRMVQVKNRNISQKQSLNVAYSLKGYMHYTWLNGGQI